MSLKQRPSELTSTPLDQPNKKFRWLERIFFFIFFLICVSAFQVQIKPNLTYLFQKPNVHSLSFRKISIYVDQEKDTSNEFSWEKFLHLFDSIMGYDDLGRPFFWVLHQGLGISILLALVSVFFLMLSTFFLLSITFSRWENILHVRFWIRVWETLPQFLILSIVLLVVGIYLDQIQRFLLMSILLGISFMAPVYRFLDDHILILQKKLDIQSAIGLGFSKFYIFRNYIFPQMQGLLSQIIVQRFIMIFQMEAFIGLLGFGLKPPLMSFGSLIQRSWSHIAIAPHLFLGAFLYASLLMMWIRDWTHRLSREPNLSRF